MAIDPMARALIASFENEYTPADEGKVVANGALVSQTSTNINANGTYNTTLNNEVVVNVPSGSVGVLMKDVNFIDYDGTIVYAYTAQEFANLSEMPANPEHDGLTAQGWNWSLSDAQGYVAYYGCLIIGQSYITDDGKTRLYVHIEDTVRHLYLGLATNTTATVDWGDSSSDTVTGIDINTTVYTEHTYSNSGDYTITINGSILLKGDATHGSSVLVKSSSSLFAENQPYANCLTRVELGDIYIAGYSFYGCYSLKTITIPNVAKLGTLPSNIFTDCFALKSVVIPPKSQVVSDLIMRNNVSLNLMSFPKITSSQYISTAFQGCFNLLCATLPEMLTQMQGTFNNCKRLLKVTVPTSMTNIGTRSFYSCSCLGRIIIPINVIYIASQAFAECYGLSEIHFKRTTPPTLSDANVFANLPTDCKIYVPTGYLNDYKTAQNYPDPNTYTYIEE